MGKPDNPESLKYLLVHDRGDDLASVFVSVIEPFEGRSNLASVRRLPVEPADDHVAGMEAVALEVCHEDGTVDYVFSALDDSVLRRAAGFEFAAKWALLRTRAGRVVYAFLVEGTKLRGKGWRLELPSARLENVVADMDRQMDDYNCIYTEAELPLGRTLAGSWLRIANDGRQDACYEIQSVRRDSGRTVLHLGDITFIRQVKDPKNYDAGCIHNFEVGHRFTIPAGAWVMADGGGSWQTRSNVDGFVWAVDHE